MDVNHSNIYYTEMVLKNWTEIS